jgi:hypothetical protein
MHTLRQPTYIAVFGAVIYNYMYRYSYTMVIAPYGTKTQTGITSIAAEQHGNQRSAYQPRIHR